MATVWTHRLHLLVEATEEAAATELLRAMFPGDDPEGHPFGIQLTNDPNGEFTHLACSTLATDDSIVTLETALSQGDVPSLRYYRMDAAIEALVETNSQTAAEMIGQSWTWQDLLADTGLTQVEHNTPGPGSDSDSD